MKRQYLGDSYDAVKRLWRDLLLQRAPLYAEPRFIPEDLRKAFTRFTRIPILENSPPHPYSILNDPDTGIRLPSARHQVEGRTHISITSIIGQLNRDGVLCVITFDQSHYRQSHLSHREQRKAKMQAVTAHDGFGAFYYVSRAPFLLAFPNQQALQEVRHILTKAGMPDERLEYAQE